MSIYYLSYRVIPHLQLIGNSFAHILHDLHMLMAKAALTTSCRSPAATSFWLPLFVGYQPTGTVLFLIIRVIVFRVEIPADHEIGLIIGENHGLHRPESKVAAEKEVRAHHGRLPCQRHRGRIADSARAAGWPDQEPLWRVGSLKFYLSSTTQLIRPGRYRAGHQNFKKTALIDLLPAACREKRRPGAVTPRGYGSLFSGRTTISNLSGWSIARDRLT